MTVSPNQTREDTDRRVPNHDPTGSDTDRSNAKCKLVKVYSSVSTTEYTGFDILGRVTARKQTTGGEEYATDYTYNLSGALIEEIYPSGRVVKNSLDTNGDLAKVQSRTASDTFKNFANSFTLVPRIFLLGCFILILSNSIRTQCLEKSTDLNTFDGVSEVSIRTKITGKYKEFISSYCKL